LISEVKAEIHQILLSHLSLLEEIAIGKDKDSKDLMLVNLAH
jgi:hypothetical protein